MAPDPHALQIYVDGSCLVDDGFRSGYAGYALYPNDPKPQRIIFRGIQESIIPRMELAACIAALEWVRENRSEFRSLDRVQIFSDSQDTINGIAAVPFRKKNKWRNADGKPYKNWDLWEDFYRAWTKVGMRVHFEKVKRASSQAANMVNQGAKEAAKSLVPQLDRGYIVGKVGRATVKGKTRLFEAAKQTMVIRVFSSKIASKDGENLIGFQVFDESSAVLSAKFSAYAQPAIGFQLHRQRGFRVTMNGNPKYPQILEVIEEVRLPTKRRQRLNKQPSGVQS